MKAFGVIMAIMVVVLLVGGIHRRLRNRRRGEVRAMLLGEEERALLCEKVP